MILDHWLSPGPDPFGQNLTQPEPNQIWAGFAQCDLGHLLKNAAESESENWWQASCVLPELGPVILAHQLAFEPDVFGQRLTRSSRSDLGLFCTISEYDQGLL